MTLRIDTHQHFWRYDPHHYDWIGQDMPRLRRDHLPDHVAPLLAEHGLDGCIAVQARGKMAETEALLAFAATYPWIRAVIGWIDLRAPDLDERLDILTDQFLLRGFRHQVQDEPSPSAFLEDATFNRGIAALQRHGYVYELLIRAVDLAAGTEFCRRHDQHLLVLDHLGKPDILQETPKQWRARIKPLAELPHVACKLSGLVTEAGSHWTSAQLLPYLNIAIELFGPQRLMFGSDWPVCLLAASYGQVYELLERAIEGLADSERESIRGGTACRIYDLEGTS